MYNSFVVIFLSKILINADKLLLEGNYQKLLDQIETIQKELEESEENKIKIGIIKCKALDTLLHFGAKEDGNTVCAFQFFDQEARIIFLDLWNNCGYGESSWYSVP